MKEDLINHEKMKTTYRYCPRCDPDGKSALAAAPGQHTCGTTLCVWTPYTGKTKGDHYGKSK